MLNREINRPQNEEKNSPLREEILKIKTENVPSPNKALGVGKLHLASRSGFDEVKMNDEAREDPFLVNSWQAKLIPGKMYTREYLCEIMKN